MCSWGCQKSAPWTHWAIAELPSCSLLVIIVLYIVSFITCSSAIPVCCASLCKWKNGAVNIQETSVSCDWRWWRNFKQVYPRIRKELNWWRNVFFFFFFFFFFMLKSLNCSFSFKDFNAVWAWRIFSSGQTVWWHWLFCGEELPPKGILLTMGMLRAQQKAFWAQMLNGQWRDSWDANASNFWLIWNNFRK